ncbi:hypothetical protein NHX12_008680, partial [Muraenolepis orangiensis]
MKHPLPTAEAQARLTQLVREDGEVEQPGATGEEEIADNVGVELAETSCKKARLESDFEQLFGAHFESSSNTVTRQRSSLLPSHVDALVFLNANQKSGKVDVIVEDRRRSVARWREGDDEEETARVDVRMQPSPAQEGEDTGC